MTRKDEMIGQSDQLKILIETLLKDAKSMGASSAEVATSVSHGYTASVRMQEVDTVEYNRDKGIGITVYFGQNKGSASTTDTQPESLRATLEAACNIAKYTSSDPCAGLADAELMAYDYPDLDLYHPWSLDSVDAINMALQCEAKGLDYDKRITNSEGASVSSHQSLYAYGNSHGFIGCYPTSRHSKSVVLIAQDKSGMQRDYDYTVARDHLDLESGPTIALRAAEKTVKRLNARRLKTQKTPVIFYRDIASGLLSSFIAAISGGNLYRKASFLLDSLGQTIFPSHIQIAELPHLPKALGSAPFDNEGVQTRMRNIIEGGVLQGYVLGSYSARKLGMQTTGNAGGVNNLEIASTGCSFDELLKKMDKGLLVTELMGHGVNIVTGDYSQGASGYWIEKGKIQFPVEEITIAGNLKNMYAGIIAVADDTDYRGNIHSGSIMLSEMMVAGE